MQPEMSDLSDTDVVELLTTSRELSTAERRALRTLAGVGWAHVNRVFARRAEATYAVASPEDFGECVLEHLLVEQRAALVLADVYHCPRCGRLLKDRRSPIASSILLERGRLRELWTAVENATGERREQAMQRFRAQLGLT